MGVRPGQCRHREGGYGGNLEQVQELKPPMIVRRSCVDCSRVTQGVTEKGEMFNEPPLAEREQSHCDGSVSHRV